VAARELLAFANYWAQEHFSGRCTDVSFCSSNHQDCESLATQNTWIILRQMEWV